MRIRTICVCLAMCTAAASTLNAQRTWIVDYANNPGTDFLDIQPAVNAAASGDFIFVRSGLYSGATISKALTIYHQERSFSILSSQIRIVGIPVGHRFSMKGIISQTPLVPLVMQDNQGQVVLDACDWERIEIQRCKDVMFNLSFLGSLDIQDSRVTLSSSWSFAIALQSPAINVADSTLILSGATAHGASGVVGGCRVVTPPHAAITAARSSIKLEGSVVLGGAAFYGFPHCTPGGYRAPSIDASQQVVIYHDGTGNVNPPTGDYRWVNTPRLGIVFRTTGVSPGGTIQGFTSATPGAAVATLMALPTFRQPTPFGDLYMDMNAHVLVDLGIAPSSAQRPISVPIGREIPMASLLMAQAVVLTPSGLGLSAPVPLIMAN